MLMEKCEIESVGRVLFFVHSNFPSIYFVFIVAETFAELRSIVRHQCYLQYQELSSQLSAAFNCYLPTIKGFLNFGLEPYSMSKFIR